MLSNLLIKSNVLEGFGENEFTRLSALDLRSISERNPALGNYFDERTRYDKFSKLPTTEQNVQWTARLFWGDKHVSLADEERGTKWIEDLATEIIPNWERQKGLLNLETAKEWLWLCRQLKDFGIKWEKKLEPIETEIREFLINSESFDEMAIEELIVSLG